MSNPPAPVAPVLAVDPGSDKCGLAVVSPDGEVLERCIVVPNEVENTVRQWLQNHGVTCIIVGNATTSRTMRERLTAQFPTIEVVEIEERNSTLEARALYWQEYPPRGLRRFVPLSAQVPPVPIDDFAAVVLARRFWNRLSVEKFADGG